MKAIGIIGYKGSGKTALAVQLAEELLSRGCKAAMVKHAPEGIDIADKDTEKYKKVVNNVMAISDTESALFLKGKHSLEEMMKYLQDDYVVVEGFKQEKTFPKILCIRERAEAEALSDGLEIAAVGEASGLAIPILNDIKMLCDIVEQKAFKLPNLDCAACGFATCYELAKEIVKGNKTISDCKALLPETKIEIDGTLLPLNPFANKIIRNTVLGMLSSLKGYKPGHIKIDIE